MMVAKQFSDEELTAFLDGELEPEKASEITDRLATDAALARRLGELSFPLEALKTSADSLLDEAPAYEEPRIIVPASLSSSVLPYAAVLALGILIGFFANTFQKQEEPDGWITAVASYQALYVEETLANANQPVSVADQVLSAFGTSEDVPVLKMKDLPALSFKRAQILGYQDNQLLQMAYTDANGSPIALCITAVDEQDRAPRSGVYDGLPAYDWVVNGKGFILIGDMDAAAMQTVVSELEGILG